MNRPDRQRQPQPLDLDAIEARVNAATEGPWVLTEDWAYIAHGPDSVIHGYYDGECPACGDEFTDDASVALSAEDATFIAHARADVPALIAEVRRLRGANAELRAQVGAAMDRCARDHMAPTPQPDHEHEWAYDRTICGFCGGNHGYCECGETEPCDPPAPQPDPLDENDHRDRVTATGIRIRWNGWHWCERKICKTNLKLEGSTLTAWQNSEHGPLTFADDPQTPQEATSGTETQRGRVALAEVAEAAHELSQRICDLLDLDGAEKILAEMEGDR